MSTFNPLFSFVIPTYNRPELLERCVQSILDQTYQNFEIIIIDDGSLIDVSSIKTRDSRIQYFKQNNAGRCIARNNGISNASGDYVVIMDDDDYFLPNYLELGVAHYKLFDDQKFILKLGAFWNHDESSKDVLVQEPLSFKNDFTQENVVKKILINSLSLGQVMIPLSFLSTIKFDKDFYLNEDLAFSLTLALRGYPFKEIETPLVVFYDHVNRSVNKKEKSHFRKMIASKEKLRLDIKKIDSLNILNDKIMHQRAFRDYATLLKEIGSRYPIMSLGLSIKYLKNKLRYLAA